MVDPDKKILWSSVSTVMLLICLCDLWLQAGDLIDLPPASALCRVKCFVCWSLLHAAVQEGHDLCSRAVVVGREGRGGRTVGHLLHIAPGHRLGIIAIRRNIREAAGALWLRGANGSPQESHGLGAGAGAAGSKQVLADAGGDALADRPLDCLVVVSQAAQRDRDLYRWAVNPSVWFAASMASLRKMIQMPRENNLTRHLPICVYGNNFLLQVDFLESHT